jgi:chromosome segregation ATPase
MGIFSKAHKALAAEVARLEGLKELHDEIKRAGSMEKLVGEVEAQKVEAERKWVSVDENISIAAATLEGLQNQAEQQREQNIKLINDARAAAERILADSKDDRENSAAIARATLEQAKAEAAAIVAEAVANKAELDRDAAQLAEVINGVRQELATTQARKADVEGEIARLRNLFKGA